MNMIEIGKKILVSDFLNCSRDGKPVINHTVLIRFLEQEGFRCFEIDEKNASIMRVHNGIVRPYTTHELFQYLRYEVLNGNELHLEKFVKNASAIFGTANHIKILNPLTNNMLQDTRDTCFIPFDNGIARITKDKCTIDEFSTIIDDDNVIYQDSIIKHNVDIVDYKDSNFYDFCKNAVGEIGLPFLMRTLGYMIHKYKNPSIAKMIAFVDTGGEMANTKANGGTGKSLIANKALSFIRNVKFMDGKSFNKNDQFKFQGVKPEHDIVTIEDIQKDFENSTLFNIITGDFTVRDLFRSNVVIPFEQAPKIIVTANSGVRIEGGSEKRRICVIGFTNFFSKDYEPIDKYKELFFVDWSKQKWDEFYSFMFDCVKLYLNNGIADYGFDVIQRKAVYSKYGETLINETVDNIDMLKSWHTQNNAYLSFYNLPKDISTNKAYGVIKDIMEAFGFERETSVQDVKDAYGSKIGKRTTMYRFVKTRKL